MKKNILFLIAYLVIVNVSGQDMKYKEIYPYIEAKNYRQAVPYLTEYLQYEPDHPSANLQLALIYEQRFKNYHPILKFKAAMKNAENAKIRFLQARLLIDEREIRRNGKKYYTNFATLNDRGKLDVEYSTVRLKIDSAYLDIDNFIRYVPTIYNHFTKSVQHYDKAAKRFAEINGQYSGLKEIYLLYNPTLRESLKQLKSDYDSTIYFFNEYLKASENYPVTDYKQNYEIKEIQHYRLDGLSIQNDFLARKVVFWDYGSWVDQVNEMVSNEIAALRRQIELNEQKLNEVIEVLKSPSQALTADVRTHSVDHELILKLRNYDYNSVVTPLLLYKNTKQDLLYQALNEYDMAEDTANTGNYETLLAFYSQMFDLSFKGDSLLSIVEERTTEPKLERHDDYLDSYYYGNEGLRRFIESEKGFISDKVSEYSKQIRITLLNNIQIYNDSSSTLRYNREEIPLFISMPDSLDNIEDNYYTVDIRMAPDSSYYVGGVNRQDPKDEQVEVFVGRYDQNSELLWMNTYEINQTVLDSLEAGETADSLNVEEDNEQERIFDNVLGAMELTPEGCAVLFSSIERSSGRIYNTFKIISEEGEQLNSVIYEVDALARNIRYNDKSNSYLLAFMGKKLKNDVRTPQSLYILRVDMDGTRQWEEDLFFSGNVKDILNVNKGYLIVGNFTQIRDFSSNDVITNPEADFTNTYIYKLDLKGDIVDQFLIRSEQPFYTDRVVKINDNSINLLGFTGREVEVYEDYEQKKDQLVHIITDSQLRILNSTIDTL